MKIFIYGDSNTWGYVPNLNGYSKDAVVKRYSKESIWWGGLAEKHDVEVNGLCGRTINSENPWLDGRNATKTIPEDLKGNYDLIILQLGTNDCKSSCGLTAKEITKQMSSLINRINYLADAQIMLLSPAQIKEGNKITDKYYKGAEEKSKELDLCFKALAENKDLLFVSGTDLLCGEDGEHLTASAHKRLGERVESCIELWLNNETEQEAE